jgi:hypothetical protein
MQMGLLTFDIRSNILIEIKFDAVMLTLLIKSFVWVCKFALQFDRRNTD